MRHAESGRDAAVFVRNKYRIVLDNYANPDASLRDHATMVVGYMKMLVQHADWLDMIADKLERAATSARVADDIWEILSWTLKFYP